jgi:hypothetical protein
MLGSSIAGSSPAAVAKAGWRDGGMPSWPLAASIRPGPRAATANSQRSTRSRPRSSADGELIRGSPFAWTGGRKRPPSPGKRPWRRRQDDARRGQVVRPAPRRKLARPEVRAQGHRDEIGTPVEPLLPRALSKAPAPASIPLPRAKSPAPPRNAPGHQRPGRGPRRHEWKPELISRWKGQPSSARKPYSGDGRPGRQPDRIAEPVWMARRFGRDLGGSRGPRPRSLGRE